MVLLKNEKGYIPFGVNFHRTIFDMFKGRETDETYDTE